MRTAELTLPPKRAAPRDDIPAVTDGRILGHEGIGIVEQVGAGVSAGGRIANVGVHGKPVELHLEKLWDRNIAITTRLVDTVTTPMLLKVVGSGKLQPSTLVTHRFAMNDIMKAYDTFGNASTEGALKVVLTNA